MTILKITPVRCAVYALSFLCAPLGLAQSKPSTLEPLGGVYEPELPPLSNNYPLGPDYKPKPDVPAGKMFTFKMTDSKIFSETARTISVYVPAGYTPDKPACLFVGLDGMSKGRDVLFDNLIAAHEIPVMLMVYIAPGEVPSAGMQDDPRLDRSFEFDSMNDHLARFIEQELIPEVEAHKTPDGQPIVISSNPNDRMIAGGSTGGIAAFTVAWQHPEWFQRVYTAIGTFVGMRGGERYYVQVRKTEPKPIRIFVQDGVYDQWPYGLERGDWFMSNLTMNRALEFAGYDVKHVWGYNSHGGNMADQILPDVMRWMWRDYPTPIVAKAPGNSRLASLLVPGEGWKLVEQHCTSASTLAVTRTGDVVVHDEGSTQKPGESAQTRSCGAGMQNLPFVLDAKGDLFAARAEGGIAYTAAGNSNVKVLAPDLNIRGVTLRNNSDLYATAKTANGHDELWLIKPSGDKIKLDNTIKGATGLAFTPDGLWLFVAQSASHQGLSYRVHPDGTLDAREPFYEFYTPAEADDAGASAIIFDTQGLAYTATRMGVQVFDRNGRVIAILPMPSGEEAASLTFGGADFHTLYVVTTSGKMYSRKVQVTGVPPSATPIVLPKGSAG